MGRDGGRPPGEGPATTARPLPALNHPVFAQPPLSLLLSGHWAVFCVSTRPRGSAEIGTELWWFPGQQRCLRLRGHRVLGRLPGPWRWPPSARLGWVRVTEGQGGCAVPQQAPPLRPAPPPWPQLAPPNRPRPGPRPSTQTGPLQGSPAPRATAHLPQQAQPWDTPHSGTRPSAQTRPPQGSPAPPGHSALCWPPHSTRRGGSSKGASLLCSVSTHHVCLRSWAHAGTPRGVCGSWPQPGAQPCATAKQFIELGSRSHERL